MKVPLYILHIVKLHNKIANCKVIQGQLLFCMFELMALGKKLFKSLVV